MNSATCAAFPRDEPSVAEWRMHSLTVAGAVQALPAGDSGTRTCFPFHSPRAERAANTHAVSRKRRDYSPVAACAARSRSL
jgi:hypothetical protein